MPVVLGVGGAYKFGSTVRRDNNRDAARTLPLAGRWTGGLEGVRASGAFKFGPMVRRNSSHDAARTVPYTEGGA